MIKAILFDCFGVLTSDVWLAFCDSLPAGSDVAQASAINRAYDKGLISRQDFENGVKDVVGVFPPLLEDMEQGQMVLNKPLIDFIKLLKPNYKISILSNIYGDWITTTLLEPSDHKLFDDILQSYEVGITKPDPRIYLLACERLGVAPNQAVMVDDRPSNVIGAIDAGLGGIIYSDFKSFKRELEQLLNPNN